MLTRDSRPHRLVVRTSRCGRDNPGSIPGVVMQVRRTAEIHGTDRMPDTPASMSGVGHAYAIQTGLVQLLLLFDITANIAIIAIIAFIVC